MKFKFLIFGLLLILCNPSYAYTLLGPLHLLFSMSINAQAVSDLKSENLASKKAKYTNKINLVIAPNKKRYQKTKYRTQEIIKFASGSNKIDPTSYNLLREYGSAMENGVSDSVILLEGHTDNIGEAKDNYNLSYKRVVAIKNFLTAFYDISPNRILVKAYGETKPIASNLSEKGRSINRRVEFTRMQEVVSKR
jgi:outer membrane protein OmpA-like peptidoglycan-associated protein